MNNSTSGLLHRKTETMRKGKWGGEVGEGRWGKQDPGFAQLLFFKLIKSDP